jgi:hypothetical protein
MQLTLSWKALWVQPLKLKCDILVSKFAFKWVKLYRYNKVAKIAKRYGHMQAIVDRAKCRAIERIVNRLLHPAFAKWKNDVAAWNRERAEEEADEADRLLLEARDDARRWREAGGLSVALQPSTLYEPFLSCFSTAANTLILYLV